MKVLLLQLDGKLPNLALMRLAAHHKARGDEVTFKRIGNPSQVEVGLWDTEFDQVYASLIFNYSLPLAYRVRNLYPAAVFGGTGIDPERSLTLEMLGVGTAQDYSLYPDFTASIGYTQRGCRMKCKFCNVPFEGPIRSERSISQLYRGEPWPKHLHLLDNDFFGQPNWRELIEEIRDGGFKVCFNQGINARMITDETAEALASVHFTDDSFKVRRLYTAWDNQRDEHRLFEGLRTLQRYGIQPDSVMVYILIGFWPGETSDDWEYRRRKLREFGCRPYPMPFVRTREAAGFQRFCIGAYDKRVAWSEWKAAGYRPEKLGLLKKSEQEPLFAV